MSSSRLEVEFDNSSAKFYRRNQEFKKQFCHIYAARLRELGSELLKKKVEAKFGKNVKLLLVQWVLWRYFYFVGTKYPIKKISELNEDTPETCVIIGTLFKDQVLKPSILKEISEDNQLVPLPPRSNYNDEHDFIILEDELQRIRLDGKINPSELITGVIAAVLGMLCMSVFVNDSQTIIFPITSIQEKIVSPC